MKVIGIMKHEQITETLIGGSLDSKCCVTRGMGGIRFVAMLYIGTNGWPN